MSWGDAWGTCEARVTKGAAGSGAQPGRTPGKLPRCGPRRKRPGRTGEELVRSRGGGSGRAVRAARVCGGARARRRGGLRTSARTGVRGASRHAPVRGERNADCANEESPPHECGGLSCSRGAVVVGVTGFEPAASSSRTTRATKLRHTPWPTLKVYRTCAQSRCNAGVSSRWGPRRDHTVPNPTVAGCARASAADGVA
ncbi:MAG: hypothetical protein K0S37_3463 [Microbacterium sp.]|nr:hypothetical protein [Microbacterium sp.]